MKKLIAVILALTLCLTLASCSKKNETVKIGATASPHAEILELIVDDMADLGYKLEIIEFTDYNTPNLSCSSGELDGNFFQHVPYMDSYNATVSDKEKLAAVIGVHYEPFAIYSKKVTSLDELADGATVAVPNDPSNETRALLMLQEAGLITLKKDASYADSLTKMDVVGNPKNLTILEVDANTLPSTLDDADIAAINGNYALDAGLTALKDGIFVEPAGGPYTNYVVVRADNTEAEWIEALRTVLCSQKVYDFMLNNEAYAGGVVPDFTVEAK